MGGVQSRGGESRLVVWPLFPRIPAGEASGQGVCRHRWVKLRRAGLALGASGERSRVSPVRKTRWSGGAFRKHPISPCTMERSPDPNASPLGRAPFSRQRRRSRAAGRPNVINGTWIHCLRLARGRPVLDRNPKRAYALFVGSGHDRHPHPNRIPKTRRRSWTPGGRASSPGVHGSAATVLLRSLPLLEPGQRNPFAASRRPGHDHAPPLHPRPAGPP